MNTNSQTTSTLFNRPTGAHLGWLLGSWALLALPTLIYPVGRDQGVFAYIGARLFDGAGLYTELWDVKSPLIYWSFGLAQKVLGETVLSIRIFDALIAALTATLIWSLTLTIRKNKNSGERRAGATVAAIIYLLWYYLPNDYRVLANCESFIQPFVILSLIFLVAGIRSSNAARQTLLLFATGLTLGVMPLFKTTSAVFLFPALLSLCLVDMNLRAGVKRALIALGGFLVPLGLTALYLWQTDAIGEWLFLNFEYLPSYTALSHQGGLIGSIKVALHFGKDMLLIYPALVAGMALFLWRMRSARNKPLEIVALFALTYAGIVIVQGKYLNYHFLPFLAPFAVVISSAALATLEDFRSKIPQRLFAVAVVTLALMSCWRLPGRYSDLLAVTGGGPEATERYYERLTVGNYPCAAAHRVGAYLKETAAPNATLFVWSFEPEIFYLSGLDPASRFLFNTPFLAGEIADPWRSELIANLSANPPDYFVVGVNDGLPLIVGSRYSSAERLQDVPGLMEFLANYYEQETQIDRFIVFRYRTFAGTVTERLTPAQTTNTTL